MNGYDILSVILQDQTAFSDRDIVHNLIGFVFAATETSHFTSQTLASHLAQSKDSVARIREEYASQIKQPALDANKDLEALSDKDLLS